MEADHEGASSSTTTNEGGSSDSINDSTNDTTEDRLCSLNADLLLLIVRHLSIRHRSRFGCTCRTVSALMTMQEAWADAWCSLPSAPVRRDPRTALRAARTLDSVSWSTEGSQTPVPWRQHW